MKKFHLCENLSKGRAQSPSIFFTNLSGADRERLPLQLSLVRAGRADNFSLKLIKGVAKRCRHNAAQVIFCGALRDGVPFPTSFWLLCPHLCRIAGSLEGENGVAALERFLRSSNSMEEGWHRYNVSHAALRVSLLKKQERTFLHRHRSRIYNSLRRGGVGGISFSRDKLHVKCLHLQIASYLGMRYHPAESWLQENVSAWECSGAMCSELKQGVHEQ